MTKEQAYEKLELPIDTDLQVVRQKFQQMHNSFVVQIDGAFNEEIRRRKQQQFAELEEAFKLLMDSDSTDISRSTPYTGKTFDHLGDETQSKSSESSTPDLSQAFAIFGLNKGQDAASMEQTIAARLSKLWKQHQAADIPAVKDVYQQEIFKAESAKAVINDWLQQREQSAAKEPSHQKQATETASEQQENATTPPVFPISTSKNKWITILMSVFSLFLVFKILGPRLRYTTPQESAVSASDPLAAEAVRDSEAWKYATATHSIAAYENYLNEHREGIFRNEAQQAIADLQEEMERASEESEQEQAELLRLAKEAETERQRQEQKNRESAPVLANWRSLYDQVYDFYEGMAVVERKGKHGVVNESGRLVVPIKYTYVWEFHEGLAKVALNGKYGFIDKSGKVVIPIKYNWAVSFGDGMAQVELNGRHFYIDRNDKYVKNYYD